MAKKQQFIGEFAVPIIERLIETALDRAAASPNVSLEKKDVPVVKERITKELEKEAVAQKKHETNTEDHWYQKRSFWSAIISTVVVVAAPLTAKYGLDIGEDEGELLTTTLTSLGGLWAAYLAYRAGTAKKPLGT